MNKQEISSIAQAMSPQERCAMISRTLMMHQGPINPERVMQILLGEITMAFVAGMTSAIENDDPMVMPQERLNLYLKTRPKQE